MVTKKAVEIFRNRKIEFEGSTLYRKEEYYNVAGVKITVRVEKVAKKIFREYWCTCKFHSVKDIDREEECTYIKALKLYFAQKDANRK